MLVEANSVDSVPVVAEHSSRQVDIIHWVQIQVIVQHSKVLDSSYISNIYYIVKPSSEISFQVTSEAALSAVWLLQVYFAFSLIYCIVSALT